MANRSRKPKFITNVRYSWRPVRWAVVRLNEDGSETYIGSESEEMAMRWAAMMDEAARENALSKRFVKQGRSKRPAEPNSLVESAETVERPGQQIAFPWLKFLSRRAPA
jgi:hypothetical protein